MRPVGSAGRHLWRGAATHDRLVLAGAAFFLFAHLAWLPRHLEDIDSINFALGLRAYDIAAHQPHPPGYPVFTVLARAVLAAVSPFASDGPTQAALAMAILAGIAGAVAAAALYATLRAVTAPVMDRRTPACASDAAGGTLLPVLATALTVATPLFWVTASRPISDMPGLASALVCQWLIVRAAAHARLRHAVAAAVACGLAVGMRSQVTWLVVPLFMWLLWRVWGRFGIRTTLGVGAAALAAVFTWAVPMVTVAGGTDAYRAALLSQAGEDFEGVPMLALQPGVGRLVVALMDTFVPAWGWWPLASVMLACAALGVVALRREGRRLVTWLGLGYLPYLSYHLLFQETETTRYALPLAPAVAVLVVVGVRTWVGRAAVPATVLAGAMSLTVSLVAHRQYVAAGATVSETLAAMDAAARSSPSRPHVLMHRRVWAETRRARSALQSPPPYDVLPAPRAREWQEAIPVWRQEPGATVWWLIDPRRGDDVAIDSRARALVRHVGWPRTVSAVLGGMRPHPFDWTVVRAPQWVLGDGWGLTPELAGLSEAVGRRASSGGAHAFVRAQTAPATLLIGGRHVAGEGGDGAVLRVAVGDSWAREVQVPPGPFVFTWTVPPGGMPGSGYLPLRVDAVASGGTQAPVVLLEQFDLQPAGVPVIALESGWYEPERDAGSGRRWRWVADDSHVRIEGTGSAVRLIVEGTWPRHYDREPVLEIFAGAERIAMHTLARPFRIEQQVSAGQLRMDGGRLRWRVSPSFVAGERTGTADARRLALEISVLQTHTVR